MFRLKIRHWLFSRKFGVLIIEQHWVFYFKNSISSWKFDTEFLCLKIELFIKDRRVFLWKMCCFLWKLNWVLLPEAWCSHKSSAQRFSFESTILSWKFDTEFLSRSSIFSWKFNTCSQKLALPPKVSFSNENLILSFFSIFWKNLMFP